MKLVLLVFYILFFYAHAGSKEQWKTRVIYQLLTDRFARTDDGRTPCPNLQGYCGGTFVGLKNRLPYIASLGFDAIWISPVITNTPGGYHGYWAMDFYQVNPHFGTFEELKEMVEVAHGLGIWVMVDVVANHVGGNQPRSRRVIWPNLISPFNRTSDYHDCGSCPSDCNINFDHHNQQEVEHCRLAGLPDLNQTDTRVRKLLNNWIRDLVVAFDFDGVRIDTVPEVAKNFWGEFQESAAVYAVGEVYDGRLDYVSGYQGPLDAVLQYPLFFSIRNCFANRQSLHQLSDTLRNSKKSFSDVSLLGVFAGNHDQARFLHGQPDERLYENALAFTLFSEGIPIIYYGEEQGYAGGNDPYNREPLWTSNYDTESRYYKFIQTLLQARRAHIAAILEPAVEIYVDDSFYAFSRGEVLVALTNVGKGGTQRHYDITDHAFPEGSKLCDVFYPENDCVEVSNGKIPIYLNDGEVKVFVVSVDE